jgi:hypothetical protein
MAAYYSELNETGMQDLSLEGSSFEAIEARINRLTENRTKIEANIYSEGGYLHRAETSLNKAGLFALERKVESVKSMGIDYPLMLHLEEITKIKKA